MPDGGMTLRGLTGERCDSPARYTKSIMDNRNVNSNPPTAPGSHGASVPPIRRFIRYGVSGAVGGGVFALIQHLDPSFLTEPRLVRWVFLYALLGSVAVVAWREATRFVAVRFSLSRRGTVVASGVSAGVLVGGAALLVATLKQGAGGGGPLLDGTFPLGLPWTDGLGGFVGGVVGGGLWRFLTPARQN